MSALGELAVGDPLVVHVTRESYQHRKVAKVGRIWLTDDKGDKFRIDSGRGEERFQFGHGFFAMTIAAWEVREETERLRARLVAAGWVPRPPLTPDQMRRAAALLSEFEAERTDGRL
jgi:hypothetical protein